MRLESETGRGPRLGLDNLKEECPDRQKLKLHQKDIS